MLKRISRPVAANASDAFLFYAGGMNSRSRRATDSSCAAALRGRPSVSRLIELDSKRAFAVAADPRFHYRWVPFTRIRTPRRPLLTGDSFTARTLGFLTDHMTVTSIKDGDAQFRKDGPYLLGTARIQVEAVARNVSRVTWSYDSEIAGPFPKFIARALAGIALYPILHVVIERMEKDIMRNRHLMR